MINKMKIGEVKKIKNGEWLVQFPKGRMAFKTLINSLFMKISPFPYQLW